MRVLVPDRGTITPVPAMLRNAMPGIAIWWLPGTARAWSIFGNTVEFAPPEPAPLKGMLGRGSESDFGRRTISRAETGDKIAGATDSGNVRTVLQKM
jgi:hypothetical protein